MKTKSKCIGCQAIKLVNALGLCKRCNTHAHDFISSAEMERMKREREMLLKSKAMKRAKKLEAAAEKEAEAEAKEGTEGEEAEEGEAGEGDKDTDADKEDGKEQ